MPINHETPPRYEDLERAEPEFWRTHDLEENEASRPPEGEVIRRPILMVAECFVGGDLQGLVDGCADLKMHEEWRTGRPDIFSWAKQVRRTSGTGGWVDIGAGHQASQKREWLDDVPVELPPDFKRVQLKAFSPTPSVVVLVATFELTAGSTLLLDEELRTDRFLRLEKRGAMTRYHSAIHRKGDAVQAERERVRVLASTWLAQTFAGTLSKDFGVTSLPCVEFITTRVHAPFVESEGDREPMDNYRRLLSIDTDFDAWHSDDIPGWLLGMPWRPIDGEWTIVAGCLETTAPQDDETQEVVGGQDEVNGSPKPMVTETYKLRSYFDGLLVRFTACCLIVQYEIAFGDLRDQLASTPQRSQRALTQIKSAQETLATLSFDASLVASEVRTWASDDRRWARETIEPKPATAWKQDRHPDHPSLTELFAENVIRESEWVLELEPRIRDELMTRSSMAAATADLRLQRIVLGVSLLALFVALIGFVLA